MQLRDHPFMSRESGFPSWPPEWKAAGENRGTVRGELGVLEDASMHQLIPNKIFLSMVHLADRYITVLAFDDEMFTRQVYSLLTKNVGRTLREIGDLDLSPLL